MRREQRRLNFDVFVVLPQSGPRLPQDNLIEMARNNEPGKDSAEPL